MANIALDGTNITESTASGHISTEYYDVVGYTGGGVDANGVPYPPSPVYGWVAGSPISATITGTATATNRKVLIEGVIPLTVGDKTVESDSYTTGANERYAGGQHTSANGSVTTGNSRNVYINGKLIATVGSSVTTHASTVSSLGDSKQSSTVTIG